jgi:hypothetical protein
VAGAVVTAVAMAVAVVLFLLRGGTPPGTLTAGHRLTPNHRIESPNGEFHLIQQYDGNLVLYDKTYKPLWQSDTTSHPGAVAEMQEDGNLVVQDRSGPLWSSGTVGNPDARLVLGDDGRLVIRDKHDKIVWTAERNV